MANRKTRPRTSEGDRDDAEDETALKRVFAVVVGLENYRQPSSGRPLPSVEYAHADAEAFAALIREIFKDLPGKDVEVRVLKDAQATVIGLQDELKHAIANLTPNDLFVFYYAGHGFHGAGENRLSADDTNRTNVGGTSLRMRADLLEPLQKSACRRALVFVDACAETFRDVVSSRDVIDDLDAKEVEEFLDDGWYIGVFLSCSPGEKSYPSSALGHGVWTHFLLQAMSGQATKALSKDRWLTDASLRDYLRLEVAAYITQELQVPGTQTPQAIVSASNTFRIAHVPVPPIVPSDAALAGIKFKNSGEFLEGMESGSIRRLSKFNNRFHHVPSTVNDASDKWCRELLRDQIGEELQQLYDKARRELGVDRKQLVKRSDVGSGNLDTPAFRYSVHGRQSAEKPGEYQIMRRLELRQGWDAHRKAIDNLFHTDFDRVVVEFDSDPYAYDDLVEMIEEIQRQLGGTVSDDDRSQRITYVRPSETFIFDLKRGRLEITFDRDGALDLVDAMRQLQLGNRRQSPMLAAPLATKSGIAPTRLPERSAIIPDRSLDPSHQRSPTEGFDDEADSRAVPSAPNSGIWEQLEYLTNNSQWSVGKPKDAIMEAAGELRSKAASGDLIIWGREELRYGDVSHAEISLKSAEWRDIDFELTNLMYGSDQEGRQTRPLRGDDHDVRYYHHLRLNSGAVRRLWPPKAVAAVKSNTDIPLDLVTVLEAANQIYDEHRTHPLIQGWERMYPNANILKIIGQHMIGDKAVRIKVYGNRIPSRRIDRIPDEDLLSMGMTDDGVALEMIWEHKVAWRPIYVSQRDLDEHLKAIAETGNL